MWEALFVRMLKQLIRHGTLDLQLPSGRKERFGDGDGSGVVAQITDPSLPRRFMINPELTIGEAYMEGTLNIENDDLRSFIALGIRNMSVGRGHGLERFFGPFLRYVSQYNPMGRARSNVAHHYDLSGALYDLFLDEDKQYSCAYFRHPDDTLEQAQIQKKAHIAQKLCLEPGMQVLDIGCGWGGMAITLAKDYGVHVVGVTLSEEQHKVARARVDTAGLSEQIDIRLTDYRALDGKFDRVVSVGMFEHVGVPHYREYFSHVSDRLTDNGIALIHTIGRESPPGRTSPWVLKYIFPGGYVPSLSEVSKAIEKEGLWTTDVEVWQMHYAETIKHWYTRFMDNIDKARLIYDDRFCRMWRFYLISAELTFRLHRQVVFQFQLTRKQGVVPLTRDYIYQDDEKQHWQAAE